MSKMLANLKIGRKLALLAGSGIGPIVCLGVLSLWALAAISNAVAVCRGPWIASAARASSQ